MGYKVKIKEHHELTMESKPLAIPMSQYPRPMLKRSSYLSLNGKWDDGTIVPFPLESTYNKKGSPGHYSYQRTFSLPAGFIKDKVLLHFDGVDQLASVYLDGVLIGTHEGGYLPFILDITNQAKEQITHTLKVYITDELSIRYPYGKQCKKPHGMWYTPVSGIWKSVWLESVSNDYIEAIEITPGLTKVSVNVYSEALEYNVKVSFRGKTIYEGIKEAASFIIDIDDPKLWTPDEPNLYDLEISTKNDHITSYFGLRTFETGVVDGIPRLLLNGKPFFCHGVLDQGYFPQGIFTPNCEKDYEDDILRLKNLGFNTIRKHIKIEPDCFYEACDRLGMIVFQDMVNNGKYRFFHDTVRPTFISKRSNDKPRRFRKEINETFELHMEETLAHLYNYPSVCYYTIFNEGWGQFDADVIVGMAKDLDPSRVFDATSGWFRQRLSDVESVHTYFKKYRFEPSNRPVVLSEFGGYSLKVPDHIYSMKGNYGYGNAESSDELSERIIGLYEQQILPAIKKGLCASIYTQITDVEEETNGLFTYDRKICKVNITKFKELSEKLKL